MKARPWTSPVLHTLRLLPRASRPLTAWVAALVVLTAALPATFAVAGGALVGAIDAAVAGGWDSAGGHRLIAAIAGVAALFVLQQLSGPSLRAVADGLGRRVEGRLRERVMAAALAPPGVAHLEDPDVVDRVSDAQSIGTGRTTVTDAVVGMAAVSSNTLAGVLAGAVLAVYRWQVALGLLGVYAAMTWVRADQLRRTAGALRGHARRFRRCLYFRDVGLTPGPAKELRIFGLGPWLTERFVDEWETAMAGFWRDRPRGRWVPPACAVLVGSGLIVTYGLLGRSAARGEISLGQLTTFAGAATGMAALSSVGMDNLNIGYGTAAVPAALELEEIVARPRFELPGSRPADGLPATAIRFEGVSFRYPGRPDDVFSGLDLTIPAGRSLAVVGANGAGKTTLVKLLARLYDPSGGRITVDGADLADLDPHAWHRRIAALFQDFVHYELSAADNIAFGHPAGGRDRSAVAAAAERAGAAEIVGGLPDGWDTVLSRRTAGGVDLSGGQWQRVALARAMFAVGAGASVLILDEPTAAVDVRSEAAFYDRFLQLTAGLTTVVISHRFSTVRRADQIAVLEGGVVAETGDHASLMAAAGRYARMFTLQSAHLETAHTEGTGG
ncbi:MAG TPA: ABC transporter ATP-binding protein [Acidimicrobiales bacterium]|nr:ABC transporter ATP-binding protein [Acidimicrobiales bacterium]